MTDVLKVTDFSNVDSTGVVDSAPGIQVVLNASFGSPSSPHGSGNATLNKPIYFPSGTYLLNSPLNLTRVVGGWIFGSATGSTILTGPGTAAIFAMNGCSKLTLERFEMINNGPGTACIDLDWDNTAGGDGLHDNVFRQLLLTGSNYGVRIAKSGFGGANNSFEHVIGTNLAIAGIDAHGTAATNNSSYGGGMACSNPSTIGYWSSGGSIHVYEPSLAGNAIDVQVDSGFPVCWLGGRTESPTAVKLTSGNVTMRGMAVSGSGAFTGSITGNTTLTATSISGVLMVGMYIFGNSAASGTHITADLGGGVFTISPSQTNRTAGAMTSVLELANITGGKISIEGVVGSGGTTHDPVINGNGGSLYLRGNILTNTGMLTNYSGTVVQNI